MILIQISGKDVLHNRRIVMVNDLAVAEVERVHFLHILISKREIPDVDILLHTLFVNGLRDDGYPALGIPFERDLGGGLSVFCADFGYYGVSASVAYALAIGKFYNRGGGYGTVDLALLTLSPQPRGRKRSGDHERAKDGKI